MPNTKFPPLVVGVLYIILLRVFKSGDKVVEKVLKSWHKSESRGGGGAVGVVY